MQPTLAQCHHTSTAGLILQQSRDRSGRHEGWRYNKVPAKRVPKLCEMIQWPDHHCLPAVNSHFSIKQPPASEGPSRSWTSPVACFLQPASDSGSTRSARQTSPALHAKESATAPQNQLNGISCTTCRNASLAQNRGQQSGVCQPCLKEAPQQQQQHSSTTSACMRRTRRFCST